MNQTNRVEPTSTAKAEASAPARLLQPAWRSRNEEGHLVLEVVLPGVKPEDLDLQVENGTLELRARGRKPQLGADERVLLQEFAWGDWKASFRIPRAIDPDAIRAHLEHGILRIDLAPAKRPAKRIALTTKSGTRATPE